MGVVGMSRMRDKKSSCQMVRIWNGGLKTEQKMSVLWSKMSGT